MSTFDDERFSRMTARCCTAAVRGKYNTISTPFNFLELANRSSEDDITVTLKVLVSSAPVALPIGATVVVPRGGRVDVGIHDLLQREGVSLQSFGVIEATHDGSIDSLVASVSYYGEKLVLRESQALQPVDCKG